MNTLTREEYEQIGKPTLLRDEYNQKKKFITDLKTIAKSEKEQIFRILKTYNCDFSENSNGVFFNVDTLPSNVLSKMVEFVQFCKSKQNEQDARIKEMESLREEVRPETV
jgi:hypothetical protein